LSFFSYFTSSTSGNCQGLSKKVSVGPYPFDALVSTQLVSKPRGAFGEKYRSADSFGAEFDFIAGSNRGFVAAVHGQ
jgi:hypothetical protein